jgi:hypothetical protein
MKFKQVGNYVDTDIITSRKDGKQYRMLKVLADKEQYNCFAPLEMDLTGLNYLDEIDIIFNLTMNGNYINLGIDEIMKHGK